MIIHPADRLNTIEEYYFSRKLKEIALLNSAENPVINLGIGSPDLMPPENVLSRLKETISEPDVHGYQPYQGIPELKSAISAFSKNHFKVDLAANEILPLIGSKEGITHISWTYLNPGDQVLMPGLGYPTYASVTKLAGAEPVLFPLVESHNWEPDWDFLYSLDYSRIKLLWINYPHMPTGARGSKEIFRKFIELSQQKGFLICHDNPYSFILNDKPLSILSLEGSKGSAIELNSLSKTFNMAGWRVGWVAGAQEYIEPVMKVKSNMDSGMFKPLQLAAVEALGLDQSWMRKQNKLYEERRALIYKLLDKLGCSYRPDQSGLFVWSKTPGVDGIEFSDHLLRAHHIFITPGEVFGEAGKNFVRISLCSSQEQLTEAIARVS